jgi:hypothetical protein
VIGRELDDQASISGRDRDFSLHRTALGLTRPVVQVIPRIVFPEVMRPKHESELHLVPQLRALSLHLHGVVITSRVS